MQELSFHHVGVGSLEFDAAIRTYERLGHRLQLRVDDPGLNIKVAFLRAPGRGVWIEILSPLGEGGPLSSLIKRRALPSPYHTCYSVKDLDAAAEDMRDAGFMPLGVATPALAFDGARVQFFLSRTVGMIELVESPPVRLQVADLEPRSSADQDVQARVQGLS